MNISFKDLLKKFGGKHKKAVTRQFSPESDWRTMLIWFAGANLLVVAWSTYLFLFAQTPDPATSSDSTTPAASVEDKTKIADILSSFQMKASSTTAILQQKPQINDPS